MIIDDDLIYELIKSDRLGEVGRDALICVCQKDKPVFLRKYK